MSQPHILSDWWEEGTDDHKYSRNGNDRVETVDHANVSWEKISIVFHAIFSLDKGAGEVANLCNHREDEAREGEIEVV